MACQSLPLLLSEIPDTKVNLAKVVYLKLYCQHVPTDGEGAVHFSETADGLIVLVDQPAVARSRRARTGLEEKMRVAHSGDSLQL